MNNHQIFWFLGRVFFLFILFLGLFYYLSPFFLPLLAKSVNAVIQELFPTFFQSIGVHSHTFEVLTRFPVPGNPDGQLAFDMNPLKYSYGFPLFLALSLACKGKWLEKFFSLVIAYLLIWLTQIWGIGFDIIRHLLFEFNGVYAVYFDFSAFTRNFISLGSQLGFLLLPSLVPIVLWAFLEKQMVIDMLQIEDTSS